MSLKNKIISEIKKYYWGQHPEAALRYGPAVAEIRKSKIYNPTILEIGSGSLGITPYFKKPIDALDINFSGPKSPYVRKIKGKAWSLPFKRNSYDISLSVDVLEHIPPSLREKSIYELIKVTKRLAIIIVPTSDEAEMQDRELHKKWNKTFSVKNLFLEEHTKYGLPQADEILVYIDRSKRNLKKRLKVNSYPILNLTVRKTLMSLWITKNKYVYYLYLKGLLPFVPILKYLNFGKTYRRVFVIKFHE